MASLQRAMNTRSLIILLSLLLGICVSDELDNGYYRDSSVRSRRYFRQYSEPTRNKWKAITTNIETSGTRSRNEDEAENSDRKSETSAESSDSSPMVNSYRNTFGSRSLSRSSSLNPTPSPLYSKEISLSDIVHLHKVEESMMQKLMHQINKVEELQREMLGRVKSDD